MSDKAGTRYDVYQMDMWADGDGGWEENERHFLGVLTIEGPGIDQIDGVDILNALKAFTCKDIIGRSCSLLTTTDRRRVYAEDLYGDGSWWEVGTVKERMPVYGIRLKEDAA